MFASGRDVTLAIRPERLSIIPGESGPTNVNVLDTDVLTRSYVGSRFEYDLQLGRNVVEVVTQDGTLAGEVRLVFGPNDAVLYPDISIPSA